MNIWAAVHAQRRSRARANAYQNAVDYANVAVQGSERVLHREHRGAAPCNGYQPWLRAARRWTFFEAEPTN